MAPTDRDVLVAFYNATDGANWNKKTNWGSGAPLDWYGVKTNEHDRVVELDLRSNTLRGPIPPELGNLAALQRLDLQLNRLSGPIPKELGSLSELKELLLNQNKLTGSIPKELGALTELKQLCLHINQLTGTIPEELGKLTALKQLLLGSNSLAGTIPAELGKLEALKVLSLGNNELSGLIPAELGKLAALEILHLAGNKLSGTIPAELGDLKELRELNLEQNWLSGAIPSELRNLSKLDVLNLEYNDLVDTQHRVAAEQDSRPDGLDYNSYAECLAKLFRNNKDSLLPTAVGIYAPWGSGKSFLLRLLKGKLNEPVSREKLDAPGGSRTTCWLRWRSHFRARTLGVVVICLCRALKGRCCGKHNDAERQPDKMEAGFSSQRKFIFVEFNAWECAGSEVLWAALISKIFDKVEDTEEFGQGVVQEKRIDKLLKEIIWDWCGIATCFAIIVVVVLVVWVVLNALIPGIAEAWKWATGLVLGIPGVLTVLKLVSQLYSSGVFDTAQSALKQAADRKQSVGESRLGFMSEVKKELETLFEVIDDHNKRVDAHSGERAFTLSVIIDDLDRCPSDKIMLVLQAMHLLLEQPQAPMVVFLAVDPRIVISAIETSLADVSNEVTGLQYLDKIIHIPFCIPRISKEVRTRYVASLLNLEPAGGQAEEKGHEENEKEQEEERKKPAAKPMDRKTVGKNATSEKEKENRLMQDFRAKFVRRGLSREEGKMFKDVFSVVEATPRKIKRVVNVYALQLLLAPSALKTKERRPLFVKWTMLAEFWPFRLLCIVYAMKADERKTEGQQTSNASTIRSVYSKDGSNSVRGRIRDFRRETRNKNNGEQEGMNKRDPHLYDESEEGFLAALVMDETIPITQSMVLDPENGFLRYCLNLNPAIESIVEATMEPMDNDDRRMYEQIYC